jgi:16S rRNA (uracil1498-N3)-methyltransferase
MRHRFRYVVDVQPEDGGVVVLGDQDSHHLARVVRRRQGDAVEAIAPDGTLWPCAVRELGPPASLVVTGPPRPAPPAPPVDLWVGLCDPGRLDLVAEKCAELGVRRLGIMATARARRIPDDASWERRAGRMARVAEAAARQSGRGTWPRPGPLIPFDHVLAETVPGQGIILDPRAPAPLAEALRTCPAGMPVTLLVGPDTGFDEAEVDAARARGIIPAGMGRGMLRAETAAIAAATLALAARGGLGHTEGGTG